MVWSISWKYLFFFNIRILRAIVGLFFSNVFQSSVFPFQLYLFIKCLIFDIFSGSLLISLWFNERFAAYLKHISSSFFGFIVFFFNFYPVRRTNIWTTTPKIYFLTFLMKSWTKSKIKSLLLINVSKFPWYHEQSDSKSSAITLFALL